MNKSIYILILILGMGISYNHLHASSIGAWPFILDAEEQDELKREPSEDPGMEIIHEIIEEEAKSCPICPEENFEEKHETLYEFEEDIEWDHLFR